MAILINSLTPTNPIVISGDTISFVVDATETFFRQLSYEWQVSTNGINYTSANLFNNTSSAYNTGILNESDNGLYVRVVVSNGISEETVFSNTFQNIGNRIIVVSSNAIILTNVTSQDNYPEFTSLEVGQTLSYEVSSALQNFPLFEDDTLLQFEWQESQDSGSTWQTLVSGGNVSINTFSIRLNVDLENIYKLSTLTIQNVNFGYNLRQYRVIVTYPSAVNTPLIASPRILFIDPTIQITRQPGQGNDTLSSFCYKSAILSSDGKIKLEVNAASTSQRPISYIWQYTLDGVNWGQIEQFNVDSNILYNVENRVLALVSAFNAVFKPNTSDTSDVLELEKMIYYETLGFRCFITGSVGESPVFTDEHYVLMKDIQVPVVANNVNINVIEDKYGDVENRNSYSEAIQRASVISSLNIARNTGLNGNKILVFERLMPGSSTWEIVGNQEFVNTPSNLVSYTLSPTSGADNYFVEYFTKPLRFELDNGIQYRLLVSSSALFNLSGSNKILLPYNGPQITVNVYRTAYILNQPQNSQPFTNTNASFSVDAIPSSGSNIFYRWQYNTSDSSTGWINVPSSAPFSGVTTNILIISNIPATPVYRFFRCIVSVPNQLSTVTSDTAILNPRRDLFIFIDDINDVFTDEFTNVIFTTNAASVSASQVQYQWQKSNNYNPSSPNSAVWGDIQGETSNTLELISVTSSFAGFYRCRVTSFGGEIRFTNAARLEVQSVGIIILKNIQSSITFLEGQEALSQSGVVVFEVQAYATVGDVLNYQWQIRRPGDLNFQNFGANSTSRFFNPPALTRSDNGSIIRCRLTSPFVPFDVFTNQCNVTVNRRFYYFADSATKRVVTGQLLFLDLNPSFTGGIPAYQWETSTNGGSSWSTVPSATSPILSISVVSGQVFRCRITLDDCNQHQYARNNSVIVSNVSSVAYTVTVTVSLTQVVTKPIFYSQELEKTGAAIGTVICVPKPSGYINNPAANTDDLPQWGISQSGHPDSFSSSFQPSSTITSGSVYNSNKPSWANSSYISPKWRLSLDRFKGFLELRGQWLKKSDFPELHRVIGDSYGSTPGSSGNFRLPNLYAKSVMGAGNVNNNSGSVSLQPRFGPNTLSGGDKNIPGTTGGYWNYWSNRQLPPGSPGLDGGGSIAGEIAADGTAGVEGGAPATFTFGNFATTGFNEISTIVQPTFSGNVSYSIPGIVGATTRTPSHSHVGVSIGFDESAIVLSGGCNTVNGGYPYGNMEPLFPEANPNEGFVDEGPAYVSNAGRSHSHGISLNSTEEPSNGASANRGEGIGSGGGSSSLSNNFTMASAGMTIGIAELTLTNQSRPIFNDALRFYFRNAEDMPVRSPYFRLRYMIKAY